MDSKQIRLHNTVVDWQQIFDECDRIECHALATETNVDNLGLILRGLQLKLDKLERQIADLKRSENA